MQFLPGNIKLIAADLDGTLLDSNHEISQRTIEAVRGASEKGYEFVICTGRRYASCLPVLEKLGCTDEVVVNNGIIAKDLRTEKTVYSQYLDSDTYSRAMESLRRTGLPFVVLVDSYPEKDIFIEPVDGANEYHLEFVNYNSAWCSIVDDLELSPSDKVIEIAVFERYATLRKVESDIKKSVEDLADCFTIRGTRYMGGSLELIPKGASKWRAVKRLLALRGISADEVLAIGDDVNDIEMIKNAGYGFAMANAFEEVKAVADFLTLDRDEDGAAAVIEKLL